MPVTSVSHVPPSLDQKAYIGPKSPDSRPIKREQHSPHLNNTISLTDTQDIAHADTSLELVLQYKEPIEQHIERRVILFWHQLLACYGTNLHFELGFTMDQGQSAKALVVIDSKSSLSEMTRNAAHSSTFPCLFACHLKEWNEFQEKKTPKPQRFTFLKGSDLYKMTNSTIDMIRAVNEADIQIDGNHHDSTFSLYALELLNGASKGEISPEQALHKFVQSAVTMTSSKIAEDKAKPAIIAALKLYLDEFKAIKETLKTNHDWVYEQLDIYPLEDQSSKMKSMVLRIRSKAIRDNMIGQTKLAETIDNEKARIFKVIKFKRKPAYIEEAFKYLVIDSMRTDEDKLRMRKFFAIPPSDYSVKIGVARVNGINKAKALLSPQIQAIETLAKDLSKQMYHMRVKELQERGDVMRALRFAKNMTQSELSLVIKAKLPKDPSSQSTISRTERGERFVDNKLARELSEIFKVPLGLLLPQFFNA